MPPATPARTPFRLPSIIGVAICGCVNLAFALWAAYSRPSLNSDFLAFWSFPRFAQAHNAIDIYNSTLLQAFQRLLYPGFHSFYPFLYPPTMLLALWWLTRFSFAVAQTLWTCGGLVAFIAAAWYFFKPPRRWFAIAAMLASPASLLNGATGETAYFTSALLLFGFAALPTRPILAGIAFGLLTLKPQLGVLIPFALLARGEWLAMFAAGAVALALIGLSCVLYLPMLWLAWAHMLPVYQTLYFVAGKTLNLNIIVTIAANLISLGVPPRIAWAVQLLCGLATAAAVFAVFRHGPYRLAVAALFTGAFLAVPHAYAYDSVILTTAILLVNPATLPAFLICAVIYLAPFLLLTPASQWFIYAIPETLLFILIIRLAFTTPKAPSSAHEPIDQPPVLVTS